MVALNPPLMQALGRMMKSNLKSSAAVVAILSVALLITVAGFTLTDIVLSNPFKLDTGSSSFSQNESILITLRGPPDTTFNLRILGPSNEPLLLMENLSTDQSGTYSQTLPGFQQPGLYTVLAINHNFSDSAEFEILPGETVSPPPPHHR